MKHWSGLVYLVAGVIVGLLVGTSLTGIAAGGDEPASGDNHLGRYTLVVSGDNFQYVFDTQTGTLYRFSLFKGRAMNPREGWYEDFAIKRRVAP